MHDSYYLPKWDLALGTAINLDNIESALSEVRAEIDGRVNSILTSILVIAGVMLAALCIAGVVISNSIVKPIQVIRAQPQQGAQTARNLANVGERLGGLVRQFRI